MGQFGSFDEVCSRVTLALCPMVGDTSLGSEATCYSRNIEIGSALVFQASTLIIDIVAVCMTIIMIYHIKTKYTAVGRKEMVMFFYLYLLTVILDFVLISGIIPTSSVVYPYFTAAYLGVTSALVWCLLLNGFVGFQFYEDGTALSLWSMRLSSLVIFGITFFIAVGTFLNVAGLKSTEPMGVFIIWFIFNSVCLGIYLLSQIVLVVNTLDEYWPLGNILFAAIFFIIGQVITNIFSAQICEAIKHYLDGMFFGTMCTLLSVMMVYKYWDSITKEDLEFSVGGKANVWEVKEAMADEDFAPYAQSTMGSYPYHNQPYNSNNPYGPPAPINASQQPPYPMQQQQGFPPTGGYANY
ncbi:Chitin synthase, class 7 [Dimargaris cristalligena]|uniref:Chitin synthase export chaperone n=1 Tax=Dimargaris cristalligena TaxID=215637 RepID=A0A4P9ZR72_9FUNG|nr:Chitin synthase, class 7 [Dimargaris cristalligena]RKP35241.1 chitin synthase III catalytic subunit [Dimargaris cristalligena]|eukprot:RKP35241.1 chitin synthase III catalytic subunit [Dimargaris cristalligena]